MGNALRHVRGESQKNIVRFIEGLSGKYSRWDIWQDFIIMSAIAIANTMGGPQVKAREGIYRSRAEKYSTKELEVFADMLFEVVAELERDQEQDFLGELFMALGEEPDWVAEQRKKDFEAYAIQRKDPWGEDEDSRLKMLLSKHRYSWAEISEMMHRSHGAIARRCRDLGIKDRPVSMELTGKRGTWTSEDFEILADGIRHGDSYAAIGKAVGRSEKCVRSKVYNDYLTENADKVREMLGDGSWGHGAPEMDVRHGFYISRARHQVRRDLSALATVLRKRMNDLGYDPYWQRFMCMNWDDIGGCSAGCTDCDSCTAFRRIQPQYCARCGGTFYERKENRFCAACRTARKKQAQRHWCRVNGMSRR